ncbi:MAG: hypothetical protein JW904_14255 [Spirochaetales bacterium]|nr:hypothetical protein [Spirochaetales bacterium]
MRIFIIAHRALTIAFCLLFCLPTAYAEGAAEKQESTAAPVRPVSSGLIDPAGSTIGTRVQVPEGYTRVSAAPGSFEEFLRSQPLRPHGTRVKYFDGREKRSEGIYCAVIDRSIGNRDLEQCADALMRIRAEYLYAQKRYSEIQFAFLHDGKPRRYVDYAGKDRSYKTFLKYMDFIFSSANTTSFYRELKPVTNLQEIKIGDIFIQKHRPINHAMMVVDMAVHSQTGEKIFLLAQSYMPAQETQIVINPGSDSLSPWYSANFGEVLDTPEWRFSPATDLRKF